MEDEHEPNSDKPAESAGEERRRPYAKPEVTRHGSLEQITEAIAGADTDGLGGSRIL